jgi:hypothetical protein
VGAEEAVLSGKQFFQFRRRDVPVDLFAEDLPREIPVIDDEIVVIGVAVDLIAEEGRKGPGVVPADRGVPERFPLRSLEGRRSNPAVMVVGEGSKIELRVFPDVPVVFVRRRSPVGKTAVPVEFSEKNAVFRRLRVKLSYRFSKARVGEAAFLPVEFFFGKDLIGHRAAPVGCVKASRLSALGAEQGVRWIGHDGLSFLFLS